MARGGLSEAQKRKVEERVARTLARIKKRQPISGRMERSLARSLRETFSFPQAELRRIEAEPEFQRMREESDRAEREGRYYILEGIIDGKPRWRKVNGTKQNSAKTARRDQAQHRNP